MTESRRCPICDVTKPIEDFPVNVRDHPFPSQRRHRYCKKCKADKMRELALGRREKWLAENGPCVQCGSWSELEMDHRDRNDKDPLLRRQGFWTWSGARREAELAKCQVLCAACHKIKTVAEFSVRVKPQEHGTLTEYTHHECRCDQCREAFRTYQRAWRAKRKSPTSQGEDHV